MYQSISWGIHVNEMTLRRLKSEYLEKLKETISEVKSEAAKKSKTHTITVDETERQAILLSMDLDEAV